MTSKIRVDSNQDYNSPDTKQAHGWPLNASLLVRSSTKNNVPIKLSFLLSSCWYGWMEMVFLNHTLNHTQITWVFSKIEYRLLLKARIMSISLPTSRKRSPKWIFSPDSTRISAFELLAFDMIDFTLGTLVCMSETHSEVILANCVKNWVQRVLQEVEIFPDQQY